MKIHVIENGVQKVNLHLPTGLLLNRFTACLAPHFMKDNDGPPITGAQAAVMLQNALDLTISQNTLETAAVEAGAEDSAVPAWAQVSLTAMADNGIALEAGAELTRAQVAQVMYRVSTLAIDAPGMSVIRMQQ